MIVNYYQIKACLSPNQLAIATEKQRAGRFILATNVLDAQHISNSELLVEYKAQQSPERGFRCLGARSLASYADAGSHCFLKDPLFFTSSFS